jgi:hypothetical protein
MIIIFMVQMDYWLSEILNYYVRSFSKTQLLALTSFIEIDLLDILNKIIFFIDKINQSNRVFNLDLLDI